MTNCPPPSIIDSAIQTNPCCRSVSTNRVAGRFAAGCKGCNSIRLGHYNSPAAPPGILLPLSLPFLFTLPPSPCSLHGSSLTGPLRLHFGSAARGVGTSWRSPGTGAARCPPEKNWGVLPNSQKEKTYISEFGIGFSMVEKVSGHRGCSFNRSIAQIWTTSRQFLLNVPSFHCSLPICQCGYFLF